MPHDERPPNAAERRNDEEHACEKPTDQETPTNADAEKAGGILHGWRQNFNALFSGS